MTNENTAADTVHTVTIESETHRRMLLDPHVREYGDLPESSSWTGEIDLADDEKLSLRDIEKYGLAEACFSYFNRVAKSDVDRLEEIGFELPSLSVGDVLEIDGRRFEVRPVGFHEITDPAPGIARVAEALAAAPAEVDDDRGLEDVPACATCGAPAVGRVEITDATPEGSEFGCADHGGTFDRFDDSPVYRGTCSVCGELRILCKMDHGGSRIERAEERIERAIDRVVADVKRMSPASVRRGVTEIGTLRIALERIHGEEAVEATVNSGRVSEWIPAEGPRCLVPVQEEEAAAAA